MTQALQNTIDTAWENRAEINPSNATAEVRDAVNHVLAGLDNGHLVRRELDVHSGEVTLAPSTTPDQFSFDGQRMLSTLGPGYRVLLIGAGALAEYLATMALFNGFNVSVCDPRPEYMGGWSVAGVVKMAGMPDDVVRAFAPDLRSAVVALSHDPKLDDLALLEALHSPAFYIGAIGSRRNSQLRRERLIEHFGETEATLKRLHGPIGIYIGSKTPAEIAVSVMAEVLAVKNGVGLRQKKDGACPVERGIVGFLAGSIFMESSLWSWTSLHIVAPPTLGIWTSMCNQYLQQVTGRTTIKQPPIL